MLEQAEVWRISSFAACTPQPITAHNARKVVQMSNELVAQTAPANAVQALAEGKQTVFSTIKGDSVSARLALFSAVTDSVALEDNLNKPIVLTNIVVQSIEMADEETGELAEVPRTILIDDEGTAFHAISKGLFRSVENLVGILGSDPEKWTDENGNKLAVIVTREGTGNRKYFTMRPVKQDSKSKASK